MGFFYSSEERAVTAPSRQLSFFANTQLSCRNCPLDKVVLRHPKMVPTGDEHPLIYILGEAPGQDEDILGEQFVGQAGDFLRKYIPTKWLKRIRWNNSVRCRPYNEDGNRPPTDLEMACCSKLQVDDIAASKPKIVIGFGGIPLKLMTGVSGIMSWHGRKIPLSIGGHAVWYFPMLHPSYILRMRNDKKKGDEWVRFFARELQEAFNYLGGYVKPAPEDTSTVFKNIECITSWEVDDVVEALARVGSTPHGLDIETNGLKPYTADAKILSIAVGTYGDTVAIPVRHREAKWSERQLKQLDEIIREYLLNSGMKWCHTAKFEQEWLSYFYGEDLLFETEWGDTQAQAHALFARQGIKEEQRINSLDDVCLRLFGFTLKKFSDIDRARLDEYPLEEVLRYNGGDTKYTHAASLLQEEELKEKGLTHVYDFLMKRCRSMVRTQAKGLVPNAPMIAQLSKSLAEDMAAAELKIATNGNVKAWEQKKQKKFKPTSSTDVKDLLLGLGYQQQMLVGKKYSTEEDVLVRIDHPVAQGTLVVRSNQKLLSTFVKPYGVNGNRIYADGLIHGNFNHLFTITNRLSSDDPNLQNFPHRKARYIRNIIQAPEGHVMASLDYGQIEARIIAMASGAKKLIDQLWNNFDIHAHWTQRVLDEFPNWEEYLINEFEVDPNDSKKIFKAGRNEIKNSFVFASFFGSVPEACAAMLQVPVEVMQGIGEEFWDDYKEVKDFQQLVKKNYIKTGYCETLFGWRRRGPCSMNELINTPIQGTAAHLVLDKMDELTLCSYEMGKPQYQPCLNVHDDLTFYLPEETAEEDIQFIAGKMCDCRYDFISVPIVIELAIGDTWGALEDVTKFASNDNEAWMKWFENKEKEHGKAQH